MDEHEDKIAKLRESLIVPKDDLDRATELTREIYSVLQMQGCKPPVEIAVMISLIAAIVKTLPPGPKREMAKFLVRGSFEMTLED